MASQVVRLRHGALGCYGRDARREMGRVVFRRGLRQRALDACRRLVPLGRAQSRAPRPRALRRTRRAQARSPGRSTDPDLEPPPHVLYAHAARAADPRVACWLESWADEKVAEALSRAREGRP